MHRGKKGLLRILQQGEGGGEEPTVAEQFVTQTGEGGKDQVEMTGIG